MPRKSRKDLIGQKFGRLTVTDIVSPAEGSINNRRRAVALCDCGNQVVCDPRSIYTGATKSCGCLRVKHGHAINGSATRTYNSWAMMHDRCRNPNDERFAHYGGRGIKVCDRWASFESFLADMGERPDGTSIDRIDNNGDYAPTNCRWATTKQQNMNRSVTILVRVGTEVMTLKDGCRASGDDYQKARRRIRNGKNPFSHSGAVLLRP